VLSGGGEVTVLKFMIFFSVEYVQVHVHVKYKICHTVILLIAYHKNVLELMERIVRIYICSGGL